MNKQNSVLNVADFQPLIQKCRFQQNLTGMTSCIRKGFGVIAARDSPSAESRGLWAPWKAVDHKNELPFNKVCKLENYIFLGHGMGTSLHLEKIEWLYFRYMFVQSKNSLTLFLSTSACENIHLFPVLLLSFP